MQDWETWIQDVGKGVIGAWSSAKYVQPYEIEKLKLQALGQLGELKQTVVIDVSFPYRKSEREALREQGSSTAEQIQQRLPRARVVKGWNHVHAQHLTAPEVDGIAASVLLAGDDPQAKQTVFTLATDMGFHPVDVGPLKATRELERLVGVMLFVRLGPLRVLSPS